MFNTSGCLLRAPSLQSELFLQKAEGQVLSVFPFVCNSLHSPKNLPLTEVDLGEHTGLQQEGEINYASPLFKQNFFDEWKECLRYNSPEA